MNEKQKHYWIYVLELNDNKYYVGMTTQRNADGRIGQHKNGFYSAQWVKRYGYKSTMQVHDLGLTTYTEAEEVETRLTFDMMKQYGIENVRGGKANYGGEYVPRFGRLFRDEDWKALTTVMLLMLAVVYLLIDKYFIT